MKFSQLGRFMPIGLLPTFFIFAFSVNGQEVVRQIAKNTVKEAESESTSPDLPVDKPKVAVKTVRPLAKIATSSGYLRRVGVNPSQTKSLSLNDAIRMALENNNDIEVARSDVNIAESNLRSLLGFYEPTITVSPLFSNNVTPQPSIFSGADSSGVVSQTRFTANASLAKFMEKGGGNYNVFFNNGRTSTSSFASTLNPSFSTSLGVSFNQPIFRNRHIDQNRRQIKIQRKIIAQSDADFRRRTIEIISQVQKAYWNLVFALRDQQNRVANLNLTKENLRQVEARIAAGAAAPLQRAEVSTELANRESEVLNASQQVSISENTLKQLILKDTSSNEWSESYVPTDAPVFSTDPVNLDNAMKDAVANRPELKRLNLQREINKIDVEYFKDQTKPQVDFNTSFSLDGLAGTDATGSSGGTINPAFVGGYGKSIANIFTGNYRTFSAGVTISFPLRNKTARANLATAEYQRSRIEAQARSQEQLVMTEVRNAVQAVETARQRVLTSRRARQNAEIQLEGERKLYSVGRSTTFLLFQRENALTNARNAEIRAETDYNKALADLQKATSTTFTVNNIVVDSPRKDGN